MYNILPTKRRWGVTAAIVALPFFLSMTGGAMANLLGPFDDENNPTVDYELKLLGKYLFFDKISQPRRQSCSSCHTPDAGWTNGTSGINSHDVAVTGANPHTVGNLKPPTATYATLIPDFRLGGAGGATGGNFWNGRAKGFDDGHVKGTPGLVDSVAGVKDILGVLVSETPDVYEYDSYSIYFGGAADQAHASPFINNLEQGLPDKIAVCELVESAKYAPLYAMAYVGASIDCSVENVNTTFGRFALAIAAYETSGDLNMFDSKRDRAIKNDSDGVFPLDDFTDQENLGHDLFYGATSDLNPADIPNPNPNGPPFIAQSAGCGVFCHRSFPVADPLGVSLEERYTSDGYFTIGTPRNVEIPGNPEPDIGLAFTTMNARHTGAHKAPTLRNVDKRRDDGFKKAYTHNGWFKSLESLVHFYNTSTIGGDTAESFGVTRCLDDVVTEKQALANNCWPEPEFDGPVGLAAGVFRFIIGDRGLSLEEEAAIVSYLKALTDIPTAKAPKPFSLRKYNKGQSF